MRDCDQWFVGFSSGRCWASKYRDTLFDQVKMRFQLACGDRARQCQ